MKCEVCDFPAAEVAREDPRHCCLVKGVKVISGGLFAFPVELLRGCLLTSPLSDLMEAELSDLDVSEMLDVRGFRGGDLLEVREDDLLDFSVFLVGSFALSVSAYKSMKLSSIKVPVIL